MMWINKDYITRKVDKIISDFSINYPIDIYSLCENLDIKIKERNIKKDGYFVRNSKEKVIFINNRISNMGHKYFVIAHELGHFFLHSDEIIQICDNISDVFNKYDIIKNTESEANIFASELLAPSRMIMKELTDDPIDFRTICVLANKYNTSVTSMAIKCVENSKTENEILICYDNKVLKWFTTADEDISFDDIPNRCPPESMISNIYDGKNRPNLNIKGVWDLFEGIAFEDVFSVSDRIKLTIINGQREAVYPTV